MDAGTALTRLFGGLLLAAGVVIALSCGLCTGYFSIFSIISLFDAKDRGLIFFTSPFLIAGLVATGVGIGVARGGIAMLRASPRPGNGGPLEPRG